MSKWIGFKHDETSIRMLISEWKNNPNDKILIKAIESADVSEVTNMSKLFFNRENFNINLNSWDVSNVTNMKNMFAFTKSFNQPLNNWDVSNVKDMSGMFFKVSSFNQDISNWDVSSVENMSHMFFYAKKFNQDISNWDVSKVKKIMDIFWRADKFNQDLTKWKIINPDLDSRELKINRKPNKDDIIFCLNKLKQKANSIKDDKNINDSNKFKEIKQVKQLIDKIQSNWQIDRNLVMNYEL